MKIMRCVKFITCPIWLQLMLSNANLSQRRKKGGKIIWLVVTWPRDFADIVHKLGILKALINQYSLSCIFFIILTALKTILCFKKSFIEGHLWVSMGWWHLRLSAKILALLRLSVNFFQLRLTIKLKINFFVSKS